MELQEWLEGKTKTVTTPSGLTVTVRQAGMFAVLKSGPAPGLEVVSEAAKYELSERYLRAGVLSPKIGDGPGELPLEMLSVEDVNFIMDAILSFVKQGEAPLAESASPTA